MQIRLILAGSITHTINAILYLMCLTLCACNYWYSGIHQTIHKKVDLMDIQKIERFVWTNISFDLKKNGCYRPSDLGGRSIVAVRQEGRWNSSSSGIFKHLITSILKFRLLEWINCVNNFVLRLVFEVNAILCSCSYILYAFLWKP